MDDDFETSTEQPDLGPWVRRKSPYLIESEIEDYGRLARSVSYMSPGMQRVVRVLIVLMLAGFVAFAAASIISNARQW